MVFNVYFKANSVNTLRFWKVVRFFKYKYKHLVFLRFFMKLKMKVKVCLISQSHCTFLENPYLKMLAFTLKYIQVFRY